MTTCRWNGLLLGGALGLESLPWAPYFLFAAESELSTGPALKHLQKQIVCLLADSDDANERNRDSRHKLLTEFLAWLEGWAAEEENHVAFFRAAQARCVFLSAPLKTNSPGGVSVQVETPHFGVLEPIPAAQSFERTLFFLLYSEVASMVWYRAWVRRVPGGTLLTALKELHRDEASHFLAFLRFALRLCIIDPLALREARLVRVGIAKTLRGLGQVRVSLSGNKENDMNWWENEIFSKVADGKDIVQAILRIQTATYERLARTSRAS
jgi:hypothetical protein